MSPKSILGKTHDAIVFSIPCLVGNAYLVGVTDKSLGRKHGGALCAF